MNNGRDYFEILSKHRLNKALPTFDSEEKEQVKLSRDEKLRRLASELVDNYFHANATVPLKLHGLTIRLRPLSYDPIALYSIMVRHIYGLVPSGYSVIDVGAHIGIFSLFACLSNAKQVFAFEPERRNFSLLIQNIRTNHREGTVHAFNLGVWSKDTRKILFSSRASAFHTFFPSRYHVGETESVACKEVNSILDEINGPIFLKVDAEGAEYEIVTSISNENIQKIEKIELEYHIGNHALKPLLPILVQFIESNAFSIRFRKDAHIISATRSRET